MNVSRVDLPACRELELEPRGHRKRTLSRAEETAKAQGARFTGAVVQA